MLGVAGDAIVVGSGVGGSTACAGDQITDHAIDAHILFDVFLDPMLEGVNTFDLDGFTIATKNVGPFECPKIGELGPEG